MAMLRSQRPCEEILILLSFGEALYPPPPFLCLGCVDALLRRVSITDLFYSCYPEFLTNAQE